MPTSEIISPYWIAVTPRPMRIALMFDRENSAESDIEWCVRFAFSYLGGRFFPIVPFEKGQCTPESWDYLSSYDPDIVWSPSDIPAGLTAQLQERLSPAEIASSMRSRFQPIQAPTDPSLVEPSTGFPEEARLRIFQLCSEREDPLLHRFISWNFGDRPLVQLPPFVNPCQVRNTSELMQAVGRLHYPGIPEAFVAECASTVRAFPTPDGHGRDVFAVVVGDRVQDFLAAWHHPFGCVRATRLMSLWVPATILNRENGLTDILRDAIDRLVREGVGQDGQVVVASASMTNEELEPIARTLVPQGRRCPMTATARSLPAPLDLFTQAGAKRHHVLRGLTETERVELATPEAWTSGSGHWSAELWIEHSGKDGWWRLPPDQDVARLISEQTPIRISPITRLPSLIVRGSSPATLISQPQSERIFAALLRRWGPPDQPGNTKFEAARLSDKGMYLRNLIDIVGGLEAAYFFFRSRFWRRVIEGMPTASESSPAWLVHDRLRGPAQKEHQDFCKHCSYDPKPSFRPDVFDQYIEELVSKNMVVVGVDTRCPFCMHPTWRPLSSLDQQLKCVGCGRSSAIDPEAKLGMRLNALVKQASKHNVIPVLLILGFLEQGATRSFAYQPQTEVFPSTDNGKALTDIDVLALVDGKFVIGEVKTSADTFEEKDFEAMRECAVRLKPDRLLFSALKDGPSEQVLEQIRRLENELRGHRTEVQWLALPPSIDEPDAFF